MYTELLYHIGNRVAFLDQTILRGLVPLKHCSTVAKNSGAMAALSIVTAKAAFNIALPRPLLI